MTGAHVAGWGRALPRRRVTNHDLAARLDTSDAWVTERTGIRERRFADADESTGPLAEAAARAALDHAGLQPGDLDLIVVATVTPETPMPATAAWVAARLGATAGTLDLNAACAGFVYALTTAAALIDQGTARTALVVGADTMTSLVDPDDRSTAVLFGDGAAAVVVQGGDTPCGIVATDLVTDPRGVDLLVVPAPGSYLRMDGREVFRRAVRSVSASIERTLARAGCAPDDVALFIPHQANARIVDAVLPRVGLHANRTSSTIDRYGNTSAASIPLSLTEVADAGRLAEGDLVLMCGFGAGLTVGTALWRWGATHQTKDAA